MQVLSAAQAIVPAIERTRNLLFRPFRLGAFLKLGLVALLTEGYSTGFHSTGLGGPSSSSSSSSPFGSPPTLSTVPTAPSMPQLPTSPGMLGLSSFHLAPLLIAMIAIGLLFALALGIVLFYLVTRLRFCMFYCLIHQSREITPGWRLYREQAWRFFKLNIGVGLVFLFIVMLIAMPFAAGFYQLYRLTQQGGAFDWTLVLSLLFPLIPLVMLLGLAAVCTDIVLRDLMLPHMALENATPGQAWAAVRAHIAAEKASFLLYGVLRILLPVATMIALSMALAIPTLIVFGVLAGFFAAFHFMFSGPLAPMGILLEVMTGLVGFAFFLSVAICFGGTLGIAIRNFSILFYGGRYRPLGNILAPPPPMQPVTA